VVDDTAWSYGRALISPFLLFWTVGMAALALAVSHSSAEASAQPLGRIFLPMAGLTAVIALVHAMTRSPVPYSLGSLVAAAAGFLAALVPAGLGVLAVAVAGPPVGMILYGAVLGALNWHLLYWIRRWPWGLDWGFGSSALGQQAGAFVTREMLEGKTLCAESVRYVLPSGARLSGLLVVTETELFFQTRLPPGQAPIGMEPVLAVNWRLDLGTVLLAKDRLGITIRKDGIARLVAARGWFMHRLLLTTGDGRAHQLHCGLFPCARLLRAIRQGLVPATADGVTWQEFAPGVCRGEVAGIEKPYFLLCCESATKADALARCRTPGVTERVRGKPRVIPFRDGSAAAYLPLRGAADAKPYLEALFQGDSVGNTKLRGGLCAGLSEEDNQVVLATVGLSQACTHGETLILG
jgi:hypothetical protein